MTELCSEVKPFIRLHGEILFAVLRTLRGLPSQHHIWIVYEIAVDGKAVRILAQVYPIGLNLDGAVTLLQEDDVADDLSSRVCLESVVRQTDRAEEISSLRDILSCRTVLCVHGVAGGDERNHAARTHLIQRLCEKVVMNGKTELVKSPVIYLILSEGHVADGKIEEVFSVSGFKARDGDVGFGIELLCDASCQAVQLHAVELAGCHAVREHTEEVADAHGGFQNIACLKAHVFHRIINGADDRGAGVMGV